MLRLTLRAVDVALKLRAPDGGADDHVDRRLQRQQAFAQEQAATVGRRHREPHRLQEKAANADSDTSEAWSFCGRCKCCKPPPGCSGQPFWHNYHKKWKACSTNTNACTLLHAPLHLQLHAPARREDARLSSRPRGGGHAFCQHVSSTCALRLRGGAPLHIGIPSPRRRMPDLRP
jgi:hypothetical protein